MFKAIRKQWITSIVCLGVSVNIFSDDGSSNNNELYDSGKYIVKFRDDVKDLVFSTLSNKIKPEKIINNTYIFSTDDIISLNELKTSIEYIVEDRIGYFKPVPEPVAEPGLQALFTNIFPANPSHAMQWDQFKSPAGMFLESKAFLEDGAWRYRKKEILPTVVAVLDTGIEYNTNLDKNVIKDTSNNDHYFGWNFSANDSNVNDETQSYHGTHVAGTIAAHGENVFGVGSNVKILPVKIPDSTGLFYESNVIKAIYWAIGEKVAGTPINSYPAKVLNMSFGIDEYVGKEVDSCSPAVADAIAFARRKGVIVVVAAGNNNKENDLGSPGGCNEVLRIASTGPTGLRSYFSNYGEGISFAAPGGDKKYGELGGILSTVKHEAGSLKSGFDFFQGTSMAAPHVAGLAGMLYSLDLKSNSNPADKIERLIYSSTHNFGEGFEDDNSCRGRKSCGHGIINAKQAVHAALASYDVIFNAPRSELLGLDISDNECRGELLKPTKLNIIKVEGTWKINSDSIICQSKNSYQHPWLKLDNEKKEIIAQYGAVQYTLVNNFSSCAQIGYDGIGCYY